MQVFASIRDRPTWIIGTQHTGWRGAKPSEPEAKQLPFGFDITDDGNADYLLLCFSMDGELYADTWHPSLDEAYLVAEEAYGVQRSEWGPPATALHGTG